MQAFEFPTMADALSDLCGKHSFIGHQGPSVTHHRCRITDDQVRAMRLLYERDMATASQVHKAFPQFSLVHIVRILDRRVRREVV